MTWIKSDIDLGDHPKTYQLCAHLSIEKPEAVGLLTLLWHFAMKYAWQDGKLGKFPAGAIAGALGWKKDPDILVRALQECGWLDKNMVVHDWLDFAGKLVNDRLYQKRRRMSPTVGDESHFVVGRRRQIRVDKNRVENKKKNTSFVKPTPEELRAYCKERRNRVDVDKWLAYYESNGWRVGRNPMKDWRAAVRTWERSDFGAPINPAYQTPISLDQDKLDAKKKELERLKEKEWHKRLKSGQANNSQNPPGPPPLAPPDLKTIPSDV